MSILAVSGPALIGAVIAAAVVVLVVLFRAEQRYDAQVGERALEQPRTQRTGSTHGEGPVPPAAHDRGMDAGERGEQVW
jgi:hypothetical protein